MDTKQQQEEEEEEKGKKEEDEKEGKEEKGLRKEVKEGRNKRKWTKSLDRPFSKFKAETKQVGMTRFRIGSDLRKKPDPIPTLENNMDPS